MEQGRQCQAEGLQGCFRGEGSGERRLEPPPHSRLRGQDLIERLRGSLREGTCCCVFSGSQASERWGQPEEP